MHAMESWRETTSIGHELHTDWNAMVWVPSSEFDIMADAFDWWHHTPVTKDKKHVRRSPKGRQQKSPVKRDKASLMLLSVHLDELAVDVNKILELVKESPPEELEEEINELLLDLEQKECELEIKDAWVKTLLDQNGGLETKVTEIERRLVPREDNPF